MVGVGVGAGVSVGKGVLVGSGVFVGSGVDVELGTGAGVGSAWVPKPPQATKTDRSNSTNTKRIEFQITSDLRKTKSERLSDPTSSRMSKFITTTRGR